VAEPLVQGAVEDEGAQRFLGRSTWPRDQPEEEPMGVAQRALPEVGGDDDELSNARLMLDNLEDFAGDQCFGGGDRNREEQLGHVEALQVDRKQRIGRLLRAAHGRERKGPVHPCGVVARRRSDPVEQGVGVVM
jgi:hypothetical protein